MAEAGYSTDKPLQLTLTYANIYGTELGDQLRSQLKPLGIDLKVNVVEFSTSAAGCVHQPHLRYFAGGPQRKPRLQQSVDRSDILFRLQQQECDQAVQRGCCRRLRQGTSDAKFAAAAKLVSEDAPAGHWLFNYRITTATAKGVKDSPSASTRPFCPSTT